MMISTRVPTLVAGTIACALAIGWGMQTFVPEPGSATPGPAQPRVNETAPERPTSDLPAASAGDETATLPIRMGAALPTDAAVRAAPVLQAPDPSPDAVVDLGAVDAADAPTDGQDVVSRNDIDLLGGADLAQDASAPGCAVSATAEAVERASVRLSIDAPCFPNDRIAIHHLGMMFSDLADESGHLEVTVPALKAHAVFIVSPAQGRGTVVSADVPDMADWTRVVLQWQGETGFQIHAREFGADYGSQGHVWAEAPGNPETGSFLVRLGADQGDLTRRAEIYSFPRSAGLSGLVDLTVETEGTADTCGRRLSAEALELRGVGDLNGRGLDLAMPNCAAIGDFLVLNNLMDDLKIAIN